MGKYTIRSPEEKAELIANINKLIENGMRTDDACKSIGIQRSQYDVWRKNVSPFTSNPAKGIRRSPDQRAQVLAKVDGLIKSGLSTRKALIQAGVSPGTYYAYLKEASGSFVARKKPTRRPALLNIPTIEAMDEHPEKEVTANVFVVVCKPSQLKEILNGAL